MHVLFVHGTELYVVLACRGVEPLDVRLLDGRWFDVVEPRRGWPKSRKNRSKPDGTKPERIRAASVVEFLMYSQKLGSRYPFVGPRWMTAMP
jgi:hypothetical protein